VSDDGFNVGLHEMAHALQMEDLIPNEEYSFLNEEALNHWHELAEIEMVRVRNGQNKFLRSYAATNQEEFFAVSVEQFFEQPGAFRNQLPQVYDALADLLQQDPLELQ
jgi:MtfA peptidase